MCSVTFWPRRDGYLLAMNRDEKWTRAAALPPSLHDIGGHVAIYPSEPNGGTWIGLNNAAVSFALVNWYAIPARPLLRPVSRGEVVKRLLATSNSDEASELFATLPLENIPPFRVAGIFPAARSVWEWRWNGESMVASPGDWSPRQWLSSGLDEPQAQKIRGQTFSNRCGCADAGEADWVRALHSSHEPQRGAFSMCVHREDAGTVSYTEIECGDRTGSLRYFDRSPCLANAAAPRLEFSLTFSAQRGGWPSPKQAMSPRFDSAD